jgi:GntR family transcriptional regulator/MocR family aminotransferase
MRRLYASRQAALVAAAARPHGEFLDVAPDDAGLHLKGWLKPEIAERRGDRGAAAAAARAGIAVAPLSDYYISDKPARQGLLLGYAAVPEDQIERGAQRLAEAFRTATGL